MADSSAIVKQQAVHPALPSRGSSALKDINYGSIADRATADSDTDTDHVAEGDLSRADADVQDVLGLSIGADQKRLARADTPAVVKAAAMEAQGGFFAKHDWAVLDGTKEEDEEENSPAEDEDLRDIKEEGIESHVVKDGEELLPKITEEQDSSKEPPSSWQPDAALKENRVAGRKPEVLKKKLIPSFNLPSLPDLPNLPHFRHVRSIPNLPKAARVNLARFAGQKKHQRNLSDPEVSADVLQPVEESEVPVTFDTPLSATGTRQSSVSSSYRRGSAQLRRVRSEESICYSVMSRPDLAPIPTLGDDSRFDHVSEMTNSRFKAFVDTFQDAEFKFPGLSTVQNLNFNVSFFDSIPSPLSRSKAAAADTAAPSSGEQAEKAANGHANGTKRSYSTNHKKSDPHPHLSKALEGLTGDIVVLGGYRGSVLRSAEPPHRRVWIPLKVGLNLRKADLEVGLEDADEEENNRLKPDGMLTHIGPVDISRRLFRKLRNCDNAKNGKLRVHDYGYDWRLSPDLLSRQLVKFLEGLPSNQPGVPVEQRGALVIAHSLGGLITRHAINTSPKLFSGVVYAGCPKTCVNILGPMRNGDDVGLSSRVLTAQVNFTLRSSFALLPLDGRCFFNKETGEEYPVDFFSVNDWIRYAWSPCVSPPLPSLHHTNSGSLGSILPRISTLGRRNSLPRSDHSSPSSPVVADLKSTVQETAATASNAAANAAGMAPQMHSTHPSAPPANPFAGPPTATQDPRTVVTIPLPDAIAYLERTLARVKAFKEFLAFNPTYGRDADNLYPPAAVLFGKSVPTVYGARVASRADIARASAYDDLAFASGDGVVLARASMLPEGYEVVRGGVVETTRGHVTMLGDLEAVGRCLLAVQRGRAKGVGLGPMKAKGRAGRGEGRE